MLFISIYHISIYCAFVVVSHWQVLKLLQRPYRTLSFRGFSVVLKLFHPPRYSDKTVYNTLAQSGTLWDKHD